MDKIYENGVNIEPIKSKFAVCYALYNVEMKLIFNSIILKVLTYICMYMIYEKVEKCNLPMYI